LRSWLKEFALVCAAISGLASGRLFAAGSPAVALLDSADASQWKTWVEPAGWKVIAPAAPAANANIDARVQALAAAAREAVANGAVDPSRIYMVGRGDAAASVFLAISRVPDLFAAGVALGGSPQRALETGRIFAANFTNTPVLWAGAAADAALAEKLKSDGMNLEWRPLDGLTNSALFEWLARHARDPYPPVADCETNSPTFASCYWLQPSKFDVNERNDVLPSTRILAGSLAALDLGGFGYKPDDPGPGIQISFLPEKYTGPLKMGDRIVEIDGKPIANARQFRETMSRYTEEKAVIVMLQRGAKRERLETHVVVQRIDSAPTARVQGRYEMEDKLVLIISRTVTEMRVIIPQQWVGTGLLWNGLALEKIEKAGCILLTIDKELLHAADCK
jgi:ribosomal protein L18E